MEKPVVIILLGAPGAGKGSQAALIKEKLNIPHIATGNLLREEAAKGSVLGLEAKAFMDRGEFPPEKLILDVLFDRISQADCERGYILDGVPRTLHQAEIIEKHLSSHAEILAINLEIPDSEILDRITKRQVCSDCQRPYHPHSNPPTQTGVCDHCSGSLMQRSDDTEAVVKRRLEVYHELTAPVIAFFEKRGACHKIDSTLPMNQVKDQILAITSVVPSM